MISEVVPLLYVDDMEAAHTFYTQGLGFTQTMEWHSEGQLSWCRLEFDHSAIMLQRRDSKYSQTMVGREGITLYFNCSNVDQLRDGFIELGLKVPEIEVAFYGLRQLELTDPTGYRLCFQSPVEE